MEGVQRDGAEIRSGGGVGYRLLSAADVDGVLELFRRTRPVFARLATERVYRALICDALQERRILIVLADADGQLVGYSIIVWAWNLFRISFMLRHPRVALQVLKHHLERRRGKVTGVKAESRAGARPPGRPGHAGRSTWSESASDVAKVIYTAVAPESRSRGIGSGLKRYYVELLRERGFRRVDAQFSAKNQASLALNRSAGWVIVPRGATYSASLDLKGDAQSQR